MAQHKFRRFWISTHQYLGLTVGLLIVILGLSGSVAVFWNELTQLLQPQYRVAQPGAEYAPLQKVMESLHAAHPDRPDAWSIDYPFREHRHAPAWAAYEAPEERAGIFESPLYVAIDPYTARIMGEFYWGTTPVSWIFNVHSILAIQSGDIGEKLVGIVGIVFLLMSLSGLYLWWPIGRFSRQQFATTPALTGPRFEFHLHKLCGFYSSLVLLCLSVTGIMIVWPRQAADVAGLVQPVNAPIVEDIEPPRVPRMAGAERLPFDVALERAMQLFPRAEFRHASMPSPNGTDAYSVTLRQPEEKFDRMYPETRVWVDPYTGEVLKVLDAKTFNVSRSVVGYNRYSFHNGNAFGFAGRVVMFIAGFVPLFLYVTGIRQWLRMRRRRASPSS